MPSAFAPSLHSSLSLGMTQYVEVSLRLLRRPYTHKYLNSLSFMVENFGYSVLVNSASVCPKYIILFALGLGRGGFS
jgi:uncharacterized membrane protein